MLLITRSIKNKVILFLTTIFLVISFSFAEAKNSKDVSNIKVQKKTISHKQKYSLQLVNSKDGHPVRSGNKSWRFEVREGDCGGDKKYSDCKSNRQRTELQTKEYQKRNKNIGIQRLFIFQTTIYLLLL